MAHTYSISYLIAEPADISSVVDKLLESGLTTTRTGRTDVCEELKVVDELRNRTVFEDVEMDTAIEEIDQAHFGSLSFWFGQNGTKVKLGVTDSDGHSLEGAEVSLDFQLLQVDPLRESLEKEEAHARLDCIVDLAGELAELVNPEYVMGLEIGDDMVYPDPIEPNERPISDHVEEFSWITIMSEPVIEEFGGREYVLETPAERIEELDSGHILILKAENPVTMGYHDGRRVDEHLLGS